MNLQFKHKYLGSCRSTAASMAGSHAAFLLNYKYPFSNIKLLFLNIKSSKRPAIFCGALGDVGGYLKKHSTSSLIFLSYIQNFHCLKKNLNWTQIHIMRPNLTKRAQILLYDPIKNVIIKYLRISAPKRPQILLAHWALLTSELFKKPDKGCPMPILDKTVREHKYKTQGVHTVY